MGCCDNMLKYVIFLFNFVVFLCSVALIAIGTYIQLQMKQYLDFLGDTYLNTSVILIIIGGVMLLISFFGCCGACTENHCMVYTYAAMMTLILLSLIGVSITIYVFKDDVQQVINDGMRKGMDNYGKPDHKGVTDAWNIVQHELKCCGSVNYKDWKNVNFSQVPDECCKGEVTDGCANGVIDMDEQQAETKIYTQGCLTKFETFITDNVGAAAGTGVGLIVLLFIGILVSCCVAKSMREKQLYV